MTKVLLVISAANRWTLNDGTVHPSGYWAEEVAVPHRVFSEAGWDIIIATPGGKAPTLDQLSLGISGGAPWKRRDVKRYLDSLETVLANPVALDTVDPDAFDLVFYPGGHGPMEDLAYDKASGVLLANRLASGKPLALLCHAPAAILAATGPDGTSPFAGYRMTGLSNREEMLNRFAKKHRGCWRTSSRRQASSTPRRDSRCALILWSTGTCTRGRTRSPRRNWLTGSSPTSAPRPRSEPRASHQHPARGGFQSTHTGSSTTASRR